MKSRSCDGIAAKGLFKSFHWLSQLGINEEFYHAVQKYGKHIIFAGIFIFTLLGLV